MVSTRSRVMSAAVLLALGAPKMSAAQNNTFFSGDCGQNYKAGFNRTSEYNTSGMVEFTPRFETSDGDKTPAPWYYIVTMHDTRIYETPTTLWLYYWLAVPEDFIKSKEASDTAMCVYTLMGQNATMDNSNSSETCQGALSDKCLTALHSDNQSLSLGRKCPEIKAEDKCGQSISSVYDQPFNISSSSCFVKELPGIDLPDNYLINYLIGYGNIRQDDDSYEYYDITAQQPSPFYLKFGNISMSGTANSMTGATKNALACAAPNTTRDGSREAQANFPPSGAPGSQVGNAMVSALVTSCIVGAAILY